MYIYEQPGWPHFEWDIAGLQTLLSEVRHAQGRIVGRISALGRESMSKANLAILTQDGAAELIMDATSNFAAPLSVDRLFDWHSALHTGGRRGSTNILVGRWRTDAAGPTKVVAGSASERHVSFQAPPATRIDHEIGAFLSWISSHRDDEPVTKAALAHLWFMTIHPFEDGNGRIARAIAEMLLARSDGQASRFYSLSPQILRDSTEYYEVLERTQNGSLDVSEWLRWFLQCLLRALQHSDVFIRGVANKHLFWVRNARAVENDRQRSVLNMLLDGMEGRLTTSKWAQIGACSQDTALRDIQKLIDVGVLVKLPGGGRSTGYDIVRDDM